MLIRIEKNVKNYNYIKLQLYKNYKYVPTIRVLARKLGKAAAQGFSNTALSKKFLRCHMLIFNTATKA